MKSFPLHLQPSRTDCAVTCLSMIAKWYGIQCPIKKSSDHRGNTKGVSLFEIRTTAEKIGFKTRAIKISYIELIEKAPKPCILHWNQNHFVVMPPQSEVTHLIIADPARGFLELTRSEFERLWILSAEKEKQFGIAILLKLYN